MNKLLALFSSNDFSIAENEFKKILKQLFILAICIYLLIDVRYIAGRNNIIAVMAICVAIGTTLNNIFETIKGGE